MATKVKEQAAANVGAALACAKALLPKMGWAQLEPRVKSSMSPRTKATSPSTVNATRKSLFGTMWSHRFGRDLNENM